MFEITCGARSRVLPRRAKHMAALGLKLLSTEVSMQMGLWYSHVTDSGAARVTVTGLNGLIWESHRPAWRWCVSLATSSESDQKLRLTKSAKLLGRGLLHTSYWYSALVWPLQKRLSCFLYSSVLLLILQINTNDICVSNDEALH